MPTFFLRPENALKRADEFIDVGKKQRALDALYDVIKSKKHRTWQKTHEHIMAKYLELCVDLRKSHVAKEGLYQYKIICQQVNILSLVDVVENYLKLAEKKTESARDESHQAVVDVDDLDVPDTPESLLLKAVSGEDTQDRKDRAILTPWVKFLWESYRQCLDLLRNNNRVERLYHNIAQQAFLFCMKYTRKTEFRKLCDNLRTHLLQINKQQHQQTAVNLNNPDSQAMHLETRLAQLDSAINMELWQEAFKAVEDIYGLISLSKKPPKPALMANYYHKLGLVFCKSGNHLFHACTLHRLYHLSRDQRKNLSQEDLFRMSSRVVCATLAIPIPPSRNPIDQKLEMDESTMEKQRHLATLLILHNPPTRNGLIKDLVKYNIIQYVYPELQNLFRWLETEFHPLKLSERVAGLITFISNIEDLVQYVPALQDIIITRVLKQVSQVYQTIEFSRMANLVPFASPFHLERVIVAASKTLDLQVRLDHSTKALTFGTDLAVAQKEDVPEGPYIQGMPSERIRNQLTSMAQVLYQTVSLIQPKEKEEKGLHKIQLISNYKQSSKKEHQRILQRRQIIEDRKEQLENLNDQREREEQEEQEKSRRKAYEAEMARLDREAKERAKQRQMEEHKEIQKRHAKERIEQLRKSELGAKVLQNIDEDNFADLDVDEIMAKQVEHLEKEKKELLERLKAQEKKVDYFARAKRLEEIPLLKKQYEEERVEARNFWENEEVERIENLRKEREHALETRDRLSRIKVDREEFMKKLTESRKADYMEKLAVFEAHLNEERTKRLEERKKERKIRYYREKAESEVRKKEEAVKKEQDEKDRAEREKREKDAEEKLAKFKEQSEKQKAREKEIEEKEAKRRDEHRKKLDRIRDWQVDSDKQPWRPPSLEGQWRERSEQEKRLDDTSCKVDTLGDENNEEREMQDGEKDLSWRGKATSTKESWRDRDDNETPREDKVGWVTRSSATSWRGDKSDLSTPREDGWKDRSFGDRGTPRDDGWRERTLGDRFQSRESGWRDRQGDRGSREDGWRDRPSDRGFREDGWRDRLSDRGSREDGWRDRPSDRGPREDGWRDRPSDRGPREDGWRDRPFDRGLREENWRDRPIDRGSQEESWRDRTSDRGPRDEGWKDRTSDRGPRDEGWRDRPSGGERGWRSRDDRPSSPGRDDWRRGGERPPARDGRGWRDRPIGGRRQDDDDDGWTTVRY